MQCPVEVRLDAGEGRGKGVFATRDIKQGDVVFRERPLAGVQHLENKLDVSACAHCFRPVGTVEQHIGGKICHLINQLSDATEEDDLQEVQHKVDKVRCRGGCGEEYCSTACADDAWQQYHCLLCSKGEGLEEYDDVHDDNDTKAARDRKGKHPATIARYDKHGNGVSCSSSRSGSSSSSSNSKASTRCQLVHGVKVKRGKLQEFYDHADQSNDIFRVAAEVIAISIIRADHLIQQQQQQPQADTEQTASRQPQLADPSSGQQQGGAGREEQQQQQTAQAVAVANHSDSVCEASEYSSLLQAAFLPFAVGHKGVWWEGVAVPDDEDDEAEFRAQIRELASDSLQHLKAAIYDPRFPELFYLQFYGSLVGMFELNNLAIAIPSPVELYINILGTQGGV
eukprot:jgi/Chrzof1/10060/Cz04g25210.t1